MALTCSEWYHRYKNTDWYREKHRKAARAYQKRHRKMGLCQRCPRPAADLGTYCRIHREAMKKESLARYYRKKEGESA